MSNETPIAVQARRSGYRSLVGYRTTAWSEAFGQLELIVGPQHMNSIGIVHGGVYASLLDVALGSAVSFCAVPGNARYSTTVSLTVTFLKSSQAGKLIAVGRVNGVEGRLATGTGEVTDEAGTLLAVAQGSFLYFPGSERPEGVPKA
jgi:uncharacterized protein (TIGR00369 family)